MNNIEVIKEQEITLPFEGFVLCYNQTKDYWYVEFEGEDDDDMWILDSVDDLVDFDIKGKNFEVEEIEEIKKLVNNTNITGE